jgi:hypothetical protein
MKSDGKIDWEFGTLRQTTLMPQSEFQTSALSLVPEKPLAMAPLELSPLAKARG